MKQSVIAVAVAAILSLGASLQAGETPAVLKSVVKKQTLTTQQLGQVRGEGLQCCTPCAPACAPACAPLAINANVKVNAQVCVNVPCLVAAHVNVNVPLAIHLGL